MKLAPRMLLASLAFAPVLAAAAAAAPKAPALDLTLPAQPYTFGSATPAASTSAQAPASVAFAPPVRRRQDAPPTQSAMAPHVWGDFGTGYGYGSDWGSSGWQSADINASKAYGDSEHPLIISGGAAGAVSYSKAFGTTQWESADVQMSKLFGSARHPFALSIGISVSRAHNLGNGNWPEPPQP